MAICLVDPQLRACNVRNFVSTEGIWLCTRRKNVLWLDRGASRLSDRLRRSTASSRH